MDGGVLRSRTRGGRMEGGDESTELWWNPSLSLSFSAFFKWANPGLFLFIFSLFIQILQFYNKKCKNVHLVWDSKSRPSDCESPPLTTRPGLFLSLYTLFKINNDLWGTTCLPGFLILKLSILLRLLNDILTSINTTQFVLVLILVTFRRIIICFVHSQFFFKKSGPFPASFYLFRLFNTVDNKQMLNKILPMTGVKPQTSGIKSDRSTNWATTTSRLLPICLFYFLFGLEKLQWLIITLLVKVNNLKMSSIQNFICTPNTSIKHCIT